MSLSYHTGGLAGLVSLDRLHLYPCPSPYPTMQLPSEGPEAILGLLASGTLFPKIGPVCPVKQSTAAEANFSYSSPAR